MAVTVADHLSEAFFHLRVMLEAQRMVMSLMEKRERNLAGRVEHARSAGSAARETPGASTGQRT